MKIHQKQSDFGNNEVLSRVKSVVVDTLNLEVVDDDASQDSLHEWDSLGYLSIMARIEEEFGIQIRQDNINNFGSISEIVSEIEKCNNK